MSTVYLFKTEECYGGETKVFTDRDVAVRYLQAFLERTGGRTDALIETHHIIAAKCE
jgi:hypothetical protein